MTVASFMLVTALASKREVAFAGTEPALTRAVVGDRFAAMLAFCRAQSIAVCLDELLHPVPAAAVIRAKFLLFVTGDTVYSRTAAAACARKADVPHRFDRNSIGISLYERLDRCRSKACFLRNHPKTKAVFAKSNNFFFLPFGHITTPFRKTYR